MLVLLCWFLTASLPPLTAGGCGGDREDFLHALTPGGCGGGLGGFCEPMRLQDFKPKRADKLGEMGFISPLWFEILYSHWLSE